MRRFPKELFWSDYRKTAAGLFTPDDRGKVFDAHRESCVVKVGLGSGIDEEARRVPAVFSDETPDRAGDVVRVAGWILDNFVRNPTMLWAHDHMIPAIGTIEDLAAVPPRLAGFAQFDESEFGDEIFQKFVALVLRAFSVGFRPIKFAAMFSDEDVFDGFDFQEQELLEISAVNVPMNPEALARNLALHFTTPNTAENDAALAELQRTIDSAISDATIERMTRTLDRTLRIT